MTVSPAEALDRTVVLIQDYVDQPDDVVVDALTAFRVLLSADERALETGAGRAALLSCFECAARVGVHLILNLPPVSLPLPPGYPAGNLREALLERSAQLITPATLDGNPDLEITLGNAIGPNTISLGGSDTEARLRVGASAGGWSGELPFGAGQAAAAAGAEITRAVIARLLKGGDPRTKTTLEHEPVDLNLPPLQLSTTIDLRDVDFVSAGAVTNAVLFLLFQIPAVHLNGRVFDDDDAHADNLNRYLLLTADDLEQSKVEHLEKLSTQNIRLTGIPKRVVDMSSLGNDGPLGNVVCTGVDWVEGRWAAQELTRGWHGIGATSHAYACASEHWPGQACAACIHPESGEHLQRMPTISFVSLLAGTLLAHRLLRQATHPAGRSARTEVLDALNLSSRHAVIEDEPAVNPACRFTATSIHPA